MHQMYFQVTSNSALQPQPTLQPETQHLFDHSFFKIVEYTLDVSTLI